MRKYLIQFYFLTISTLLFTVQAHASLDSLEIIALSPQPNQVDVTPDASISITFNQSVQSLEFDETNFVVYGERAGRRAGRISRSNDSTIIFIPAERFAVNDRITAILVRRDTDLGVLDEGFLWEFEIAPTTGSLDFQTVTFTSDLRLTAIAAAELNGDSFMDVVYAGETSAGSFLEAAIYENGQFVPASRISLPDRVRPLYAADVNADGLPDFILLHRGATRNDIEPRISICHLLPNGDLSLEETFVIGDALFGFAEPRGAVVNDLNQDGFLDIVVMLRNERRKAAFVYLNDGSGHFASNSSVTWFDPSSNAESILGRDLNNTGFIDIGIGHTENQSNISLFMNGGNADYPQRRPDRTLLAGSNRDIELAKSVDLNSDFIPDVLGVDFSNDEIFIFQNEGTVSGIFRDIPIPAFQDAPSVFPTIANPNWLQVGDIDADGDLDLALTGSRINTFQILINEAGDFSRSKLLSISANPINFSSGDFNGDGALDFLVADTTGLLTLLLNNAPGYEPPDAPVLISPVNEKLISADSLIFTWDIPADPNDGDELHFRITFVSASGDSFFYNSSTDPSLFSPLPPAPQGVGIMSFTPPTIFDDGYYSWYVEAWDGLLWSEPSSKWHFTLDSTPPENVQISFPKADFNGYWFAVQGASEIVVQLSYSENAADYAVLNTDGIGGPFTYPDIPSGENVMTELSFTPDPSPDGEYEIQVEVFDKAGYSSIANGFVGVDRNAPTGGVASVAADTSATREFRVFWGGATDGTGSGLSGFYRVQYRVNGGAWLLWITGSDAGDSLFQGKHGNRYEFEASAYDNVGFAEPFTDTPEAETVVNIYANDTTAPPPPLNIRANGANPSPWQNGADYTVFWDVPADESGIKASFWKLGAPPASVNNFDDTGAPKGPANITVQDDGVVTLYVWLSDSAGNVDHNNTASIDLRRDASAPELAELSVTNPAARFIDGFGNSWYNSAADKNFNVNQIYTEVYPESAILTTDGLSDSLINKGTALPRGSDVSTTFAFSIANPADRLYTLKSTITDSAANRASKSIKIGLDGNVPQNSLASAPAISATEEFVVSWSAGTDGTGSGIAGYDLYYKQGAGDWQFWFSATQPGDSTFVGENGVEYWFEAVARDNVGLKESFSTNGETKVLVDLSANDNEPPPPPVNLQANGASPASPWSKTSTFTITWTKPDDESGVVGSFWKIGSPPVSNTDTSGVGGAGPAEGPMTVQMTTAGKQWFYLWLMDAKGNVDFQQADSVQLRLDNVSPKISNTRFLNAGYGEDWFNPKNVDSAYFEVTYNEQFASVFKLNSAELNYNIQDNEPHSGVGVKKLVPLALKARADQSAEMTITLTDSAGNTTQAIDTLRLDSTPPSGSRAESPPESGTTSFQVSWSIGDDLGVGVSDTFDVYVKINESGWTRWQHNYVGRSALFENAKDGNFYHFEAISRDWLGNMETRTYENESTTFVNVALNDSLAPGTPINLRANGANPSPWQKSAEFSITWQAPNDPSGTPKAWYKLGTPPNSNSDTSGSFIGQPPMPVKATNEGRQNLYVWLEDGARNTDFRQSASVILRYDATVPKVDSLVLAEPRPAFWGNDVGWYNPTVPPHKSALLVYFRDRFTSSVLLEPSALFESGGIIPRPGADSVRFDLQFAGFADNVVTLNTIVADSAENNAEASITIGLDSTAPLNTLAQSPDTTKPGDFLVSWDVSRVIEKGSGLSGIFDVRVKIDDADWTLWRARYEGTSILYSGQVGHTYGFEVAAYDNVGNKESFKGVAESQTTVVQQFEDNVPPGPPTDITINGFSEPTWHNSTTFTVSWTSPPDPSGIAKVYYKFFQPPTRSDDFDGSDAGTPPISIEFDQDGVAPVYLWLQDGAGNSNFTNHTRAWIKYDGAAPNISKSIVTNAVFDNRWLNPDSTTLAQIRITYTEAHPDSMRLYLGDTIVNEQQTGLSAGIDQNIDFIIPLADVNDGCYPLLTVLQDSAGNVSTDTLLICLDSTPPVGALASSPERSVSNKFTVTWAGDGLGTDVNGSGLSGEYDLKMRIGDGQWFDVLSRARTTSFPYVGTHGNTFSFEVAAWDNTGNREAFTGVPETTTLVDTAFVDQTAPEAPVDVTVRGKNPSPWQNYSTFRVEWKNPTDPSGIRTAYLKFDNAPISALDYSDSVSVETSDGFVELTITEEDGKLLYIWLEDGRGNSDFTKTAAIMLNYDATSPVILSVQSENPAFQSNWYNQKLTTDITFNIVFDEKHVDSLYVTSDSLPGKRIKLSEKNISMDTARVVLNVANASDGAYTFYFELSDSARNRSEKDSVHIFLDSLPPRVTHVFDDTVVLANTIIPIQATAADANDIQDVRLVYWQGGERNRTSISMTLLSDSTYQADIPALVVGDRGIEYLIVVNDGVNQNRFPLTAQRKRPLGLRVQIADGLSMPSPLAYGTEENAYRMLAFPLDMQQRAPSDVLEPKLGAYDDTFWRFFRWNPVDALFQEYPEVGDLKHGHAYWIITTKSDIQLETGPGLTVNTTKPYTVVLKKGWNDIGLPFNFAVDWNDIIAASAVDTHKVQGPHGYAGRWEYPFENSTLQPWVGYSIYSDEDDLSLIIPALEAAPALAKTGNFAAFDNLEWAFQIKASCNDMVDAANLFGCSKEATDAWDYGLDFIEAPEIGSYISLYFEHKDWAPAATRFTTDIRPLKKGHIWDFQVISNKTDHAVKLSFQALKDIPKSLQVRLVDPQASVTIDLMQDSTYTFQFSKNENLRDFRIYAGDPEFMQAQEGDLSTTPTQSEPVRNYPNPFNSSTVISYELKKDTQVSLAVYNLLAQKVRQLRSGFQDKGFYQITWDARDDNGRELGTGVYIIRLETTDLTYTRKMVYMR